jgi:alpha-L-fucosidase 2
VIHNAPANLMTVFPGEHHGLDSNPEAYEIAANTYRLHRNEGGTELVFLNLQGARLGVLDLERFKRQIEYCRMPNGVCTNRVLEAQGRYHDSKDFDFMSRMGIWIENFALPAVINECLLQGYNGTIRLFPNWPKDGDAEFRTLRSAGAFLVSAARSAGEVQWVEILSEAGAPLRVELPWKNGATCIGPRGTRVLPPGMFVTDTTRGEILRLCPE